MAFLKITICWGYPFLSDRVEELSPRMIQLSGNFSSVCNVISTMFGIGGGSDLIATACTASTNAVGLAYDMIQNNKTEIVVVIGTDPLYLPTYAGFHGLQAMAHGPCSPFSSSPGMSIGEDEASQTRRDGASKAISIGYEPCHREGFVQQPRSS